MLSGMHNWWCVLVQKKSPGKESLGRAGAKIKKDGERNIYVGTIYGGEDIEGRRKMGGKREADSETEGELS